MKLDVSILLDTQKQAYATYEKEQSTTFSFTRLEFSRFTNEEGWLDSSVAFYERIRSKTNIDLCFTKQCDGP